MLYKYEIFFLLKTSNLIINWVPLSPVHTQCGWKANVPHNLTKHEIKRTPKIPIFHSLVNWEQSFSWIGKKLRSPDRTIFKNPISFCELGKTWKNGLRILTEKKHPKTKLQRLRKMRIWTFGSLVQQIKFF